MSTPTDELVDTVAGSSLSGGTLSWNLSDDVSEMEVAAGSDETFFVVATARSGVTEALTIEVLANGPQVEDADHDIPLDLELPDPIATGIVIIGDILFADDFETGDTSAWSSSIP